MIVDKGGRDMYGAVLGDIIGSRFEFDTGDQRTDFELFTSRDYFTDDSVMTAAVAEALLSADKDDEKDIKDRLIECMQRWGRKYPDAGYGARFIHWIFSDDPRPYGSYGNGSAMRVSAAGWLYDSLEKTRQIARYTSEVSHDHSEGIKGAECTAAVIYLSRTGRSKEYIKDYVIREFGYDLSETLDELRRRHRHDESCMDSLPKALISFFEGNSYEDVIRKAVSLGGDTDTIAAIAGGMAEGYYEIPEELISKGNEYLTADLKSILMKIDTQRDGKQ